MAFRLFVRFKEPSPRFIRGRIRISKARPPNSVRATIAPASQPAVALTFQMNLPSASVVVTTNTPLRAHPF